MDSARRKLGRAVLIKVAMAVLLAGTAITAGGAEAAALAPLNLAERGESVVPGQYLVVLKGKSGAAARARSMGIRVDREFSVTINAYAAKLTAGQLLAVRKDPDVAGVYADHVWKDLGEPMSLGPPTSSDAPDWSADRIDQRHLPLNGKYRFQATGAGVSAYVVGSGIRRTHLEFGDRVKEGFSTVADGRGTDDCTRNGTFAAALVGGLTRGAAKDVSLVPVRIRPCDSMPSDISFLAGIEFITEDHLAKGGPSVAVMTIGHANSDGHGPLNAALTTSMLRGVVWVTTAGDADFDLNACDVYPGSLGTLINVGGSTRDDHRASRSAKGGCVDLFAPGANQTSASSDADDEFVSHDRADYGAALVAGVAALHLERDPAAQQQTIKNRIIADATPGVLDDIGSGSPNLLLYSLTQFSSQWNFWVQDPDATLLSGDFDKDGDQDMALTGPDHWVTLPVAFSNGDGSFKVTNLPVNPAWIKRSADPNAKFAAGDFNMDGYADVVVTGGPNATRPLVALSNGDGTFTMSTFTLTGESQVWAPDQPNTKLVGTDLGRNGIGDLLLVGPNPPGVPGDTLVQAEAVPQAFRVATKEADVSWPELASDPDAQVVSGDFNGDGDMDLALAGGEDWDIVAIAFNNAQGGWDFHYWPPGHDFAGHAAEDNAHLVAGDFDGDRVDDLAVLGTDLASVPVALSNGDGSFQEVSDHRLKEIPVLAQDVNVKPLTGDFNNDGALDVLLTGGDGWYTVEVAFGKPGESGYTFTSEPIA
ncbi:FG-GAP-like repeat-containing protein [Acrocarpospora corrugata]|uniref:FG-GAP-like repeat-containing protein n=1 Tax=Acrocarpospora corrugata TaxID=35763 RepID=UPI0012D34D2F|nr:FG-GAP-like repeat-containing protein [Acrocarpospora corrugata]